MSHFTTLQTQIVEKKHLVEALRDLGHAFQEGGQVRDFEGNRAAVELRIATGNPEYDIGLRREPGRPFQGSRPGPGGYAVVADWWGIRGIEQEKFLSDLQQRYAYRVTRARLEEQGFALAGEEVQADGRIHLVLRRTV